MEKYLQIGKIANTHGVKGEIKVLPLTDDPSRYETLDWVYIDKNGKLEKNTIEGVKYFKNFVILKLKGLDNPEDAEKLKNMFLVIDRENAVKLPEGSYFVCDLIDCEVFDEQGVRLGVVSNIIETGSNDVYVVKCEGKKDILVPALRSVVLEISIKDRFIKVKLPEGLVDDEI